MGRTGSRVASMIKVYYMKLKKLIKMFYIKVYSSLRWIYEYDYIWIYETVFYVLKNI